MRRRPPPVKWDIDSPEWGSFRNYLKSLYRDAIKLALEILREVEEESPSLNVEIDVEKERIILGRMLDKLLSPMVYIYDRWEVMPVEDKLKYATPEYREILKEALKAGEQAAKKFTELTSHTQ